MTPRPSQAQQPPLTLLLTQIPLDAAAGSLRAGAGVAEEHGAVRELPGEKGGADQHPVSRVLAALPHPRRHLQQPRQPGVGRCLQTLRALPASGLQVRF